MQAAHAADICFKSLKYASTLYNVHPTKAYSMQQEQAWKEHIAYMYIVERSSVQFQKLTPSPSNIIA